MRDIQRDIFDIPRSGESSSSQLLRAPSWGDNTRGSRTSARRTRDLCRLLEAAKGAASVFRELEAVVCSTVPKFYQQRTSASHEPLKRPSRGRKVPERPDGAMSDEWRWLWGGPNRERPYWGGPIWEGSDQRPNWLNKERQKAVEYAVKLVFFIMLRSLKGYFWRLDWLWLSWLCVWGLCMNLDFCFVLFQDYLEYVYLFVH